MKLRPHKRSGGYALIVAMIVTSVSLLLLIGTLNWSTGSARLVTRNSYYLQNSSVSEVATEKVIAAISQDYQSNGEDYVYANLSSYQSLVPTTADDPVWSGYEFNDGQGHVGNTYVTRFTNWSFGDLQTRYSGLKGYSAGYRIVSNARALAPHYSNLVSATKQEIQVASIPIFEFAAFYAIDMEICPVNSLTLPGRVHCNGNIYIQPQSNVTFSSHVTSSGKIYNNKNPADPTTRSQNGVVTFQGLRDANVRALKFSLGTNNSSASLHKMIELPPGGESTNSLVSKLRYYNKADLVFILRTNGVSVTSGAYNNFGIAIPAATWDAIINTNIVFFDMREGKFIPSTDFDVSIFNTQLSTLTAQLGRTPRVIYFADLRPPGSWTGPGVRLINCQTLNSNGFTFASYNPLYIKGHFNCPAGNLGTTNTSGSFPASIVADSVTVLSGAWNDADGVNGLDKRKANNTTINAAMITGIVPTTGGYYSGGIENVRRLLEDWSGKTLTFNGSTVVLFASQIAVSAWGNSSTIYVAPIRQWAFDSNFLNPAKLPPGTPEIRTVLRTQYAGIAPNTIQ